MFTPRIPPAVLNLIIITVLAYVAQRTVPGLTEWAGMHYYKSDQFKPHQLLTYMFMHDDSPNGISHILFNMLGLWMWGSITENYIGPKKFLLIYFASALGAAVLTQLTIPFSTEVFIKSAEGQHILSSTGASPQELDHYLKMTYTLVGASGGLMGVMAAFATLFPNLELGAMLIPIRVKAKYVIILYVLGDLFGGMHRVAGDNVAHFAHLGGAIVGYLMIRYWQKNDRRTFY